MKPSVFAVLFLAASLALILPGAARAEQRIGFVNPHRVINDSRIGRLAQTDLARMGQEKDRLIRAGSVEIEQLRSQIDNGNLDPNRLRILEEKLGTMIRQHERLVEDSNVELQLEEARLIQFIMRRADVILRDIALRGGYTMIITDPDVVGFVDPGVDLTEEVIRQLDASDN